MFKNKWCYQYYFNILKVLVSYKTKRNFKTAELEKKLKYLYFTDDMILYIENHKKVGAGLGLRAFPDLLTALLSWAEPAGC